MFEGSSVVEVTMPRFEPIPDPSGSVDPPGRRPQTAVGDDAAYPEPPPHSGVRDPFQGFLTVLEWSRRWATLALDLADAMAAPITQARKPR